MNGSMNTKIHYLYRDADNYKVHNSCVIKGVLTPEQINVILSCCDAGEYFIPNQVGLPERKFEKIDPQVDHCWFELTRDDFEYTDQPAIDFRTWLISQGKDIYMDAMRDPDTLAANPHAGNEMNFEAFSACAIDAYERKLNLTGMDRYTKPYDDLDKHALSDQLVMDIQSEIPQHPDAPSIHLPRNYSVQFPRIWARMSDQPSEASPAPPNPDRSAHRIFKINDLFGEQIDLQPRVELYSVRDFMGQEMPGLAIVLDEISNESDGDEEYAVLTVSFGEFICLGRRSQKIDPVRSSGSSWQRIRAMNMLNIS